MSSKDTNQNAASNSDKLFDEITRLLASPVSRRQALKLAGISLTGALLTRLGIKPSVAQSSGALSGPTVLFFPLQPSTAHSSEALAAGSGRQVGTIGKNGALWTGTSSSAMTLGFQPVGVSGDQVVGNNSSGALLYNVSSQATTNLKPAAFPTCQVNGVSAGMQVGYGTAAGAGQGEHALLWQGTAASVADLHPVSFDRSFAFAASPTHQVGYGLDQVTANFHAIAWQGTAASATDIHPTAYDNSYAYGVSGTQIVGSADGANIGYAEHAMLWTNGNVVDLHPSGFSSSRATSTNGARQVGWGVLSGGNSRHALVWFGAASSALDLHSYLPNRYTDSMVTGTDEFDNIVGSAKTTAGAWEAVLWRIVPGVTPNHGGNAGRVTVQINSAGDFALPAGTTATLVQPNILGQNPTILDPSHLQTTFDLTTAQPGNCDVLLTFPDGTTKTLPGAFTVEQGGAAVLVTSVVGRTSLRAGAFAPYTIIATNTGNIDVSEIELRAQFPNWFTWQLNGMQAEGIYTGKHNTSIGVKVPYVPALGVVTVPLQLKAADVGANAHRSFQTAAWANTAATTVTYIGDMQEPTMLVGSDAQDNIIVISGAQNASGQVTTMSTAQITDTNNNTATVNFDNNSRPTEIQGSPGGSLSVQWPSRNVSVVTPTAPDGTKGGSFDVAVSGSTVSGSASSNQGSSVSACDACQTIATALNWGCIFTPWADTICSALVFTGQVELIPLCEIAAKVYQYVCLLNYGVQAAPNVSVPAFPSIINGICDQLICNGGSTITSGDPNDITGPAGTGTGQYLAVSQPLTYAIYFENEPTATAAAQTVVIVDQLDLTGMDITSFSLGAISVGNTVVTPMPNVIPFTGTNEYNTTVDLRPATNLLVNINASLNQYTGVLTWRLTSIDPATGMPVDPSSPDGFLPPDTNPPYGEGYVIFTIGVNPGALTNYVLNNQATIVFDANAPINTPTWSNTIDNTPPVSSVSALPAKTSGFSFPVSWTGADIGSGIRDYTIYVSDNGGPFVAWLTNTPATTATYIGESGHTYAFYSTARDLVYNVEAAHTQPDAITTTPALIDVTGKLQISSSGLTYNSETKLYNGTITIKNNNRNAITGPLSAVLSHLPSSVTLTNANGTFNSAPYVTADIASLAPRGIIHLPVQFSVSGSGRIGYSVKVYSGTP